MESETAISSRTSEQTGFTASDNIGCLFQRDTLLVENFCNDRRGKTLVRPEQRLMLAILEDALQCFQDNCSAKYGKKKQLFENVEKWFFEQAVVGFSALKAFAAFWALSPITFVRGWCGGGKRNYQNVAPLLFGSMKTSAQLPHSTTPIAKRLFLKE